MQEEPIMHSHITDFLPKRHSLAHKNISCDQCHVLVHAENNECMQTWFETEEGNFCTDCFKIGCVMPC